MARLPQLVDHRGMPIKRADLQKEVAAPSLTGVRSPLSGYPGDGLTPARLASILREADGGDPIRYLELAEIIEERDPHYLGVLGTRKRSVTQLPFTVDAGGDTQADLNIAKEVEEWLKRDELADELFDILDAVGKGYSHTEIVWDYSMSQWWPRRLEYRDPRWFGFDRSDLKTPVLLDDAGQETPYPAFKFIFARMQAKSGLPLRSGLARVATWNWLFKAYTQRDWAIFTQTYGQPIRVGKYGPGASEDDRDTLFKAVANIGGDCAAIIPDSMMIEFIESKSVGSTTGHYQERSEWLDKQISKAVLGQTATTDAETGGLGSGKEHREVQEDIEKADAGKLAAILNRDLVVPFVQLNYGPQASYPRLKLERPEEEDLKSFADAIAPFIDRGLLVDQAEIYDKFGLTAPSKGAKLLRPSTGSARDPADQPGEGASDPRDARSKYPFNTQVDRSRPEAAEQASGASAGRSEPPDEMADVLVSAMQAPMGRMMAQIEAMFRAASSLEELRETILSAYPHLDVDKLMEELAEGLATAELGGRAALEEDSG